MICNAKVINTFLGIEDHGIFTAFITLDYGGLHQGFGGYALDVFDKEAGERLGHAFGITFLKKVLQTLEVTHWERLKGIVCRVAIEDGKIVRIGHYLKDQWFNPQEHLS